MKLKYKVIRQHNTDLSFIRRLSLYLKDGSSYKLHLITDDDQDEPHTHPWDFSSMILFGGYWEENVKYSFMDINIKMHHQKHKIKLFRLFGIKIPTITFGIYTAKKQLCSFCEELGYCKTTRKPL